MPDFELERLYDGAVIGLDEVGRGPLAGPVVAAGVFIPEDSYALPFIAEITDSKKLSKTKLKALYTLIDEHFVWCASEVSPAEIDEINILQASLKAMRLCAEQIDANSVHALIDGNKMPADMPCGASTVIKGDAKSVSIAAASIMAKVTRDQIMCELHEKHPHYGWNTNAGYPSKAHMDGIDAHGITKFHRKSFAPVRNFIELGRTRNPLNSAG